MLNTVVELIRLEDKLKLLHMKFENFAKIADSLCQGVDSADDFEKLKRRVVPVHPFAVREISVGNTQIRKKLRRKAYV